MVEKKKRGRPKKVEPVVEEEIKAPVELLIKVELPIKYVGSVALKPDDPRFADTEVGSFVNDTKTNEVAIGTSTFPPSWKEFEGIFAVGIYNIHDSKTGTDLKLIKAEDSEKWIQYIEEAEFVTTRGVYHIVGVTKVYEAQ